MTTSRPARPARHGHQANLVNSAGGDDDDGLNTESETPLTWFDAELGAEETLDCWIPPSIRGF